MKTRRWFLGAAAAAPFVRVPAVTSFTYDVNRDGIRTATVFYPARVFYEQHFPTDVFVNRAGLEYVRDVMALEEQA